jgi:preprotein translocase subunit SecE
VPKNQSTHQPNFIVRFFNETSGELRKVTWPTRDEALRLTAIVLAVMIVTSIFLGAIDALLTEGFRALLG